jgi:hypothetical protein
MTRPMKRRPVRSGVVAILAALPLLASLATMPALAQVWVPEKHKGSIALDYRQAQTTRLTGGNGDLERFGNVIVRTMVLNLDYGLGNGWAISAALPYASNRYTGDDPHDPTSLPFANDQRFIDDGLYHGGWTDWSVGLRYQWLTRPFKVTPFVAYSHPTHDYTFFAHSALGADQWSWQLGVHVGDWLPPPWQKIYWQAGYTYSFMQPLSHRRVDHGVVSLTAGIFVTQRLDLHLGLSHQNSFGPAINLPDDFFNPDGSLNPDNLYYHDQLAAARYSKFAIGADYLLGKHYQLSLSYGRSLSAVNTHYWDYTTTVGVSRSF